MTKRFLITILSVTAIIIEAMAQGAIGSIKIHPIFGNQVTKVIDTGSMVYYLSDNSLFSYDKDNDESDSYSRNNRLNDSFVKNIYYNYDKQYLVVVYDNSNIDILTDNGSTINVPDINNADLQSSRTINDVTFAGDHMYVATGFGFVVFDDSQFKVEYSRILNTNVSSVAATDDYLWINADHLYYCNLDNPPTTLAGMAETSLHESARLVPVTDDPSSPNTILFAGGWLYRPFIDSNGQFGLGHIASENYSSIQPAQEGFIATNSSHSTIAIFDAQGNISATHSLPSEMNQSVVSSMETNGQMWDLSPSGLRHIQIDDNGNITVLSDYYHPNASSTLEPFNLVFNSSTGTLLIADSGQSSKNDTYNKNASHIDFLTDGWWTDMLPDNFTLSNPESGNQMVGIYSPVFAPYDPETYFIGSRFEGAFKIKGNQVELKYDESNSPITMTTVDRQQLMNIPALQFDAAGNLWMIQATGTANVMVLPSDKVQSNSISRSDWIDVNITLPSTLNFRSLLYITRRNDIKIIADCQYDRSIYFINDNGNPASSSIETVSYESGRLYDQDGTSYNWRYVYCFAEDNNGNVWMGTFNGVIYFNPANAFSSNFSITRPRIPRNDGTNYADNLLDGIAVTAIAVDGANRKWIGTQSNGIYLVNEDGSEILRRFSTDNSALPSNAIYSLCCATNSNSVFAGTSAGVVEIFSDASQPSSDFNSVYAYPNPVRPEYTGEIAIVGLMENSLVKIADSSGNVVRSLQSVGGTAVWDGNNSSGKRVKTGVYFVLTSQSDGSNSSGKVATKILFIN